MMQFIRDHAQGWFATLLLGFICIPFALWGVQSYIGTSDSADVAVVDGDPIGMAEYRQAYERTRSALEAQLGEQAAQIDPAMHKREVIEQLLRSRLIKHYAAASDMRVSDPMVAGEVTRIPAFQSEGIFSPDLYTERLRYTGMSRRGFEEQMREELAYRQFRQGVIGGSLVTAAEIDVVARLRAERRDIDFVQLSVDAMANRIEPDEAALRTWYESHRDEYLGEPSATVEYVTLGADAFVTAAEPEAGVLEALYEENRSRYEQAEERRVRHILIEVPSDADELAVEAARTRAESIRARIAAGEDFALVAEEASDDPGTARSGGDLGFFSRGVMDAVFEEAAFAQLAGELGLPVRSAYGFHIIRVEEVRPGTVRSLDEVRAELLSQWQREQGERRYFQELERLETLAFESGDNLQALADALGLEVVTENDFRASTARGVLSSPELAQRVFDPALAASGLLSQPIEVGTNRVVVLKVLESRPAAPLDFEAARARVLTEYSASEARARVNARGEALLERLSAGEDLEQLLEEGETFRRLEGVTRNHPELPRAAARLAFRVPAAKVEQDGPQVISTVTGAGNFILGRVRGVRAPEELTEEIRAAIDTEAWTGTRREAELTHIEAELRRRAAIEINEGSL